MDFNNDEMNQKQLLLLHTCCAPCGAGCVRHPFLTADGQRDIILYYSNSNLDSAEEFNRRLEFVRKLGDLYSIPVEVDPYDHDAWLQAVQGLENAPEGGERCRRCFAYSLSRTAGRAGELGCRFATTLTVSPRKSSRIIFETGQQWPEFEALDFKKKNGYLNGTRLAREQNFYRQNYCGCEFSKSAAPASGTAAEITPPPSKTPEQS